jgi:hypothetical protein
MTFSEHITIEKGILIFWGKKIPFVNFEDLKTIEN